MKTPDIVPDFTALRVAVVGDVLVDHFVYARPLRISREGPVMVLRHSGERFGVGGAANVALNLWTLGATTRLLGAIGEGENGRRVLDVLASEQIDVSGVLTVPGWRTPCKMRVMGAEAGRTPQQILRVDHDPEQPTGTEVRNALAEEVRALAGEVDALLVSDYGYGLVGDELARAAAEVQAAGATVVLDPRKTLEPFRGVSAMMPNQDELASATERLSDRVQTLDQVARAARDFRDRFEPTHLVVTLGNRGMAYFSDEHPDGLLGGPAGAETVVDIAGAGDTAAATLTVALATGVEGPRAMRLANAAAGVVVMEHGTAVCPPPKLRSSLPRTPQLEPIPGE